MTRNSFSNSGVSNSQGNSAYNGAAGPSRIIVTGAVLGGRQYAAYPEMA